MALELTGRFVIVSFVVKRGEIVGGRPDTRCTVRRTRGRGAITKGREIRLRLYNNTIATPATSEFVYFVGRNTGGVNLAITTPVEVPVGVVGDLFQLQVLSASDTFTNTVNIGTTFTTIHVSEGQFL